MCLCVSSPHFAGLLSLTLLDLTRNLFSSVPRQLPDSVQQLYLSHNNISQLNDNSFMGLSNLQYLRLSHCGLQSDSIHPQALNISSLMELDLSYNKLTVVPTVPTTLQYLYLEANEIQGEVQLTFIFTFQNSIITELCERPYVWPKILFSTGRQHVGMWDRQLVWTHRWISLREGLVLAAVEVIYLCICLLFIQAV